MLVTMGNERLCEPGFYRLEIRGIGINPKVAWAPDQGLPK